MQPRRKGGTGMALSELQVSVLRAVAAADAVSVSVLVTQREQLGARRWVIRAALSWSLRRLWRLGAVALRGTRSSLTLAHSTAHLMADSGPAPPALR